jgi:inorganic triphosphatase YgiF
MSHKDDFSTETEVTLLICSEKPRALADEIARLRRIGFFRLGPTSSMTIRDLYLDTDSGTLSKNRWALRLRTVGARRSITLKGPSRSSGRGDARRLELESPWSHEAIQKIRDELAGRGMPLDEVVYHHDDPERTLASLGLQPLQRRKMVRRKRSILGAHDRPGNDELMVDAVSFLFSDTPILHWELEIETGAGEAFDSAEAISQELLDMYEPALQRWNYGKLGTGMVLEKLIRSGSIQPFVREDGSLKPAAYEAVEQELRSSE